MEDQAQRPIGVVTCPNCQVEMPRMSLKLSETDERFHETVHRCPQCEAETRRWVAL